MQVKSLKINSFRGIRDLKLDFEKNSATVIIGVNGVGKTSILDCLAILLSSLTKDFIDQDNEEKNLILRQEDIHNNSQETKNEITILWEDSQEATWELSLPRSSKLNRSNFNNNLKALIEPTFRTSICTIKIK